MHLLCIMFRINAVFPSRHWLVIPFLTFLRCSLNYIRSYALFSVLNLALEFCRFIVLLWTIFHKYINFTISTVSSYRDFYMNYVCINPIPYDSHCDNSFLSYHSSSLNCVLNKRCTSFRTLSWKFILSFPCSSLKYALCNHTQF